MFTKSQMWPIFAPKTAIFHDFGKNAYFGYDTIFGGGPRIGCSGNIFKNDMSLFKVDPLLSHSNTTY